jgi:vitamin B12 transporter
LGYINRDKQNDQGVETEVNYQPNSKLSLRASYAYVTGKTTQSISGKDTTFNNLIRRPKHTVNLNFGYQFTDYFFVSINAQFFSKRQDIFYNPATYYSPEPKILASYALVNAYAEYEFEKRIKLFLDINNLFDKDDYYEVYGFNVQGINITGGLRFKF